MRKFLCIVFGVLFFASVAVAAAYAAEQFSEHWVPKDRVSAAEKYWSKERMKNAKPYPLRSRKGIGNRAPTGAALEPSGLPGFIEGYPGKEVPSPSNRHKTKARDFMRSRAEAAAMEPTAIATVGYNYPPPHTTFFVLDELYGDATTPYPYRTIGKIFFTEDGEDYVCSGASIGGRAVLTAGHCVSDGDGTYHSNWTFVPSYYEEEEPYGEWSAFWLSTFPEYHNGGDESRDVAFAAVNDKRGVSLSEKVGALGFAFNQNRIQHWNMFGYPADDPWDGEYMVETQASYAYVDDSATPKTTGIGTTQTSGCSGGPWILKFKPGPRVAGKNFANGVNSYAIEDTGEIYSPYFDGAVKTLRDKAVAK